uniref:Uncharacterized protein n=1 Tax=Anguilla anguilla TaxID=7936 RepID=A0A0E9T4I4_ANGAN
MLRKIIHYVKAKVMGKKKQTNRIKIKKTKYITVPS